MRKVSITDFKSRIVDFREFVQLLWVNVGAQSRNFVEFLKIAIRYYSNLRFCKIDLSLLSTYLLNNPFVISKEFLKERGENNVYAYGETPLTTMDRIAKECRINSSDTVFELGSGRGRTCFWLNTFIGCKVVGIEYIPAFVTRANEIKSKFNVQGVEFRDENMLKSDLSEATVVYLYGTTLDDKAIVQLVKQFQKLKVGTKIITISYPVTDYAPESTFEVMKRFPVSFPWGDTDAYLQMRV